MRILVILPVPITLPHALFLLTGIFLPNTIPPDSHVLCVCVWLTEVYYSCLYKHGLSTREWELMSGHTSEENVSLSSDNH